jgi:hypothetical protein
VRSGQRIRHPRKRTSVPFEDGPLELLIFVGE